MPTLHCVLIAVAIFLVGLLVAYWATVNNPNNSIVQWFLGTVGGCCGVAGAAPCQVTCGGASSFKGQKEGLFGDNVFGGCTGPNTWQYGLVRYPDLFRGLTKHSETRHDLRMKILQKNDPELLASTKESTTSKENMAAGTPEEDTDETADWLSYCADKNVNPEIKKHHAEFVRDRQVYARQPSMPDVGIEYDYIPFHGLGRISLTKIAPGARQEPGLDYDDYVKSTRRFDFG